MDIKVRDEMLRAASEWIHADRLFQKLIFKNLESFQSNTKHLKLKFKEKFKVVSYHLQQQKKNTEACHLCFIIL